MSALRISTDKAELDLPLIHRFLSTQAYWSQGIPEETAREAFALAAAKLPVRTKFVRREET